MTHAPPDQSAPATTAVQPRLTGLSDTEVQLRRARGQAYKPPASSGRSYRQIIVENVFTSINVLLFGLGVALVLVGRPLDGLVSTGIITMNVLVSMAQEIRAKRMLDQIALLTRPRARVVRDGQERDVSPDELVLDDVLAVSAGDQIFVDGHIVGDGHISVDESQLTGESESIVKRPGDPVYSGSFCISGTACYVAERVGSDSLAGHITSGARAFRRVLTPLQRGINLVTRLAVLIVGYLEFLLLIRSVLEGTDLASNVQNATIVAGLVPNGLFLSISVAYALAAVRIVRQGVLVQQSNAVESLSNVDTLCLDKTGTLTTNRLQVHDIYPLPEAGSKAEFGQTLGAVIASSTSQNTTSQAIATAYPSSRHRLIGEIPFSSARKWSAIGLDDTAQGADEALLRGVYVLGAAAMLRPSLTAAAWDRVQLQTQNLASLGLRVLLLARAPLAPLEDHGDASALPAELTPLGLVSLSDELRPNARETLLSFVKAGVNPKIISGDDPETVVGLARQVDLQLDLPMISGPDLQKLDARAFAQAASDNVVFGRITPDQKERLVRALHAGGAYVAMIGDGVNDVLSLKAADVGIAMQSGAQATRSVADIVLLQDSFASLLPAVDEGRRIVNGMVHILQLFLARIATMALVIVSALVVGEFPLALRQVSIVTLLSVGIPSFFLAVWAQPERAPAASVPRRVMQFVVPALLITPAISLLVFYGLLVLDLMRVGLLQRHVPAEELARFYANALPVAQTGLATFLVCCGLLLVVFSTPPNAWWAGAERVSTDRRPTVLAGLLGLVFVAISVTPPLADLFALSAMDPTEVALLGAAAVVWLVLVRAAWRRHWLVKFLGVEEAGEPTSSRPPVA
jgi:cation-transporting P-type ATPase E